jgi:hypothetical protein
MISLDDSNQLSLLGHLYIEIGILEKLLRVTIPRSLGASPENPLDLSWILKLNLDAENRLRVEKALKRRLLANKNLTVSISEFIPLSFWRWVLHSRHFTSLWIPYTHQILIDSGGALSMRALKDFERRLYRANQDRNVVAHYNTSLIKGIDASLENVRWLQEAMGLVKAE